MGSEMVLHVQFALTRAVFGCRLLYEEAAAAARRTAISEHNTHSFVTLLHSTLLHEATCYLACRLECVETHSLQIGNTYGILCR